MNRGAKTFLLGLALTGLLAAAPVAAGRNLTYHGGPVAHTMNVVLVPWGSGVRSTYTDPSTGDPAFLNYLASQSGATSNVGSVLAQYMDTTGHNSQNHYTYGGLVPITPQSSETTVQDSTIQTELQANIQSGVLPAPGGDGLSTIYMVLFPPQTNVCSGTSCAFDATTGFCAYHSDFQLSPSTDVLYAAMVDNGPSTQNSGLCGSAAADINNQTAVLTHEFGEAVNDPLISAWYDSSNTGEIADKCDSLPLTQNGPWTVERLWSNLDGQCEAAEPSYSAPTSSFLAPSATSPGQSVSFDGSSSSDPARNRTAVSFHRVPYSIPSGITSYQWNWGDGSSSSTSSGATASHSYAGPGNFQVSLTVTDGLGFTSTVTHQLAVAVGASTPPVLNTTPASAVSTQSAILGGSINPENQAVRYQFIYGTSPGSLTQSTPLTAGPTGASTTAVNAALNGLTPSTTYYYELQVLTDSATYVGSPPQSFTTPATATPPATQAPQVATGGATQVSSGSAVLTGDVNPGGPSGVSYRFSYGTSPSNLSSTSPTALPGGTAASPVSAFVTGLSPGTTYYFRLDVSLNGTTYSGTVNHFTTVTPLPSVTTGPASAVTSHSATVSGTVNPNGVRAIYFVEFGQTRSYGHSSVPVSAGSGTATLPVSVILAGLRARTTYHYRLVVLGSGGTAVGADNTFTTRAPPVRPPRFSFRPPRHGRADAVAVRFACDQACVAHFVITTVPTGIPRGASRPLTVAAGIARLRRAGSGTATLTFRHRLVFHSGRRIRLLISGYADSAGSAPSSPQSVRVTLG